MGDRLTELMTEAWQASVEATEHVSAEAAKVGGYERLSADSAAVAHAGGNTEEWLRVAHPAVAAAVAEQSEQLRQYRHLRAAREELWKILD